MVIGAMSSPNTAATDEDVRSEIIETVRRFVAREVIPVASDLERSDTFPEAIVEQMRALGLFGVIIPEEYGGGGGDTLAYALAVEELTRVDSSVAITLCAHTSLGTQPIYVFGSEEQKRELIAILDCAAATHLNAIVMHVRPNADALYASDIEPWSDYISGDLGRPPDPFYDPLAFAIEEAHKRGLELHAWLNPYRTRHPLAIPESSPQHMSRTHPEFVHQYGRMWWLDPGEPDVRAYVVRIVRDIVRRYDVDAIHFDDYFYPYPENNADFPDDSSYQKWAAGWSATSGGDRTSICSSKKCRAPSGMRSRACGSACRRSASGAPTIRATFAASTPTPGFTRTRGNGCRRAGSITSLRNSTGPRLRRSSDSSNCSIGGAARTGWHVISGRDWRPHEWGERSPQTRLSSRST